MADENTSASSSNVNSMEVPKESPRSLVFVSYRHDPDEPIAIALKRLIESSINPTPEVFVAGSRGLRPSSLGYKSQLQQAVRRARAFIGIISQTSLEREWLYYEAGAAWGREQLYAPLLVGTDSKDLGTTIADYQATRAHNRQEMETLIQEIATSLSAEMRDRFGTRFSAFESALKEYLKPKDSDLDGVSEADPLVEARRLYLAGRTDEARERYEQLEREAETVEGKSDVRLASIIHCNESEEVLELLSDVPEVYKETARYYYCIGAFDAYTDRALQNLRRATEMPARDPSIRRMAFAQMVRRLELTTRVSEAIDVMLQCLRDADGQLRHEIASLWCTLMKAHDPLLLLLMSGYGRRARSSLDLLSTVVEIALDNKWIALAMNYGVDYDREAERNEGANQLGRIFHLAGLGSLAYKAYARAAESGVDVAKCNMALLVGKASNPAAALAIMDSHQGAFRSAAPDFPYRLRADLLTEQSEEEGKARALRDRGRKLNKLLNDLFETAVLARRTDLAAAYMFEGAEYRVEVSTGSVSLTPLAVKPSSSALVKMLQDLSRIEFKALHEKLPLWRARHGGREYLLTVSSDGDLTGISYVGLDAEEPDPRRVRVARVVSNSPGTDVPS